MNHDIREFPSCDEIQVFYNKLENKYFYPEFYYKYVDLWHSRNETCMQVLSNSVIVLYYTIP